MIHNVYLIIFFLCAPTSSSSSSLVSEYSMPPTSRFLRMNIGTGWMLLLCKICPVTSRVHFRVVVSSRILVLLFSRSVNSKLHFRWLPLSSILSSSSSRSQDTYENPSRKPRSSLSWHSEEYASMDMWSLKNSSWESSAPSVRCVPSSSSRSLSSQEDSGGEELYKKTPLPI